MVFDRSGSLTSARESATGERGEWLLVACGVGNGS